MYLCSDESKMEGERKTCSGVKKKPGYIYTMDRAVGFRINGLRVATTVSVGVRRLSFSVKMGRLFLPVSARSLFVR